MKYHLSNLYLTIGALHQHHHLDYDFTIGSRTVEQLHSLLWQAHYLWEANV